MGTLRVAGAGRYDGAGCGCIAQSRYRWMDRPGDPLQCDVLGSFALGAIMAGFRIGAPSSSCCVSSTLLATCIVAWGVG